MASLISGVILLLDRSVEPGDVIAVGASYGWIDSLGARYVSVVTRDAIEHLIPHEELITSRVENWSYSNNLLRLRAPIGISYGADVRLAMRLCLDAARAAPRVLAQPEPACLLTGFGNSSVELELCFWLNDPQAGTTNVGSAVLLGSRTASMSTASRFPSRSATCPSGRRPSCGWSRRRRRPTAAAGRAWPRPPIPEAPAGGRPPAARPTPPHAA